MADRFSKEQRSLVMSHIRSSDTKPETTLRRALWHMGFRYVVNDKRLPGKPDMVLPKYRTVVFIHGCFWHAHKGCGTFKMPRSNTEYWGKKIANNIARDQEVWRQLEAKGWSVIIVWECQLKKAVYEETIQSVVAELQENGKRYQELREERKVSRLAYLQERKTRKEKEEAFMAQLHSR